MPVKCNYNLIGFLFVLMFSSCSEEKKDTPIRNVVVIIADDHALKVTGAYENPIILTPNIDRLAEEGVLFTHAYCNSPICSASRQSILTGKYPHATGVNLLFTPFPDEGNITIAEHLRDKGFKTALIGKTHFNNWAWAPLYKNGLPDHGFDLMVEGSDYQKFLKQNPPPAVPNSIETYGKTDNRDNVAEWMNSRNLPHAVADQYSSGTYYANRAAQFIRENRDSAFFLWMAFFQPHHPYYYPIEYAGKYNPADMPLPEGSPEDDRWVPAKFKNLTDDQKRGVIAAYYTSTEYMDKNLGIVLSALRENGLDENTLVVYLSDNGYLLHDHKRFEKHTMWEEAVRQPMIFKAANLIPQGKKQDALVEYVDVVPTILDLLQVEPISEVQGKSFSPLLKGLAENHRDYAFSEYLEDNMAMVCNHKWKYVFTTGSRDLGIGYATGLGPSGIVHRLYDLESDPLESRDVSKEYPDTLQRLQQVMLQRFMETHPDAQKCPEELTLTGKLVWFAEPRDVGVDQTPIDNPVRVFEN